MDTHEEQLEGRPAKQSLEGRAEGEGVALRNRPRT